ncbi:thioredoxin [Propionibacteriaceae bacterium G1746]|uniref:thioredoxin n=1 Tax=Aestuariimicrobium sp. G57 TaxID=3418485 RepID=UPI003C1A99B1
MSNVVDVTDANFAEVVLQSPKPVLVDYWADWCAPCKQLSPIVEELAAQHGDKVTFVKMDTNANTAVPAAQGIMSLPTLQVFVGGEVVTQLVGAKSKAALTKALAEYL